MSYNELREAAGMTTPEMCRYFNVSYGTARKWETGEREPAPYLLDLMKYKLEKEGLIKSGSK